MLPICILSQGCLEDISHTLWPAGSSTGKILLPLIGLTQCFASGIFRVGLSEGQNV